MTDSNRRFQIRRSISDPSPEAYEIIADGDVDLAEISGHRREAVTRLGISAASVVYDPDGPWLEMRPHWHGGIESDVESSIFAFFENEALPLIAADYALRVKGKKPIDANMRPAGHWLR